MPILSSFGAGASKAYGGFRKAAGGGAPWPRIPVELLLIGAGAAGGSTVKSSFPNNLSSTGGGGAGGCLHIPLAAGYGVLDGVDYAVVVGAGTTAPSPGNGPASQFYANDVAQTFPGSASNYLDFFATARSGAGRSAPGNGIFLVSGTRWSSAGGAYYYMGGASQGGGGVNYQGRFVPPLVPNGFEDTPPGWVAENYSLIPETSSSITVAPFSMNLGNDLGPSSWAAARGGASAIEPLGPSATGTIYSYGNLGTAGVFQSDNLRSGGGGGMGGAASGNNGGVGRNFPSFSTGLAPLGLSTIGGGGGGCSGGSGGSGGGGRGSTGNEIGRNVPDMQAQAYTGGGGGGGWMPGTGTSPTPTQNQPGYGGNGAGGLVAVKIDSAYPPATTTGSPTITTSGGYTYYVYTGAGSFLQPS